MITTLVFSAAKKAEIWSLIRHDCVNCDHGEQIRRLMVTESVYVFVRRWKASRGHAERSPPSARLVLVELW